MMSDLPITAVIFDLDGVLYDFDPAVRAAYLAQRTGLPAERIAAVFRSAFEQKAEAGAYTTGADYLAGFNQALGGSLTREEWVEARRRAMRPHQEIIEAARALASQVMVGVLTNNGALLQETMPELCAPVHALAAERCWVSCRFGARKPEVLVFQRLAEALGVAPETILFIDDSAANCEGARDAGLQAHHHRNVAETLEALNALREKLSGP